MSEFVNEVEEDVYNVATAFILLRLFLKCYCHLPYALKWSYQHNFIAQADTSLVREEVSRTLAASD